MRTAKDPISQRAALRLLSLALATPSEIAVLAGVSRQLIESWAKHAGLDWRRVRNERIGRHWFRELQRGHEIRRKAQVRKSGMPKPGGSAVPRCKNEEALADPLSILPTQSGRVDDTQHPAVELVQVQQMRKQGRS